MNGVVLDASAVLAFVYDEDGAEDVEPLLEAATISTVNWSETLTKICLLYTSPSPRDRTRSRMPSSA